MNMLVESYTNVTPGSDHSYSRLLEEIAYLEARLITIGQTGDCAYEKAMARSYRELLANRRQTLTSLGQVSTQHRIENFLAQSEQFLQSQSVAQATAASCSRASLGC